MSSFLPPMQESPAVTWPSEASRGPGGEEKVEENFLQKGSFVELEGERASLPSPQDTCGPWDLVATSETAYLQGESWGTSETPIYAPNGHGYMGAGFDPFGTLKGAWGGRISMDPCDMADCSSGAARNLAREAAYAAGFPPPPSLAETAEAYFSSQPWVDVTQDPNLPDEARFHMCLYWPFPPVGPPIGANGQGSWVYYPQDPMMPNIWLDAQYLWQQNATQKKAVRRSARKNGWIPPQIWEAKKANQSW